MCDVDKQGQNKPSVIILLGLFQISLCVGWLINSECGDFC